MTEEEEGIEKSLQQNEALGMTIQYLRHTEEEKATYGRIIADFNVAYYDLYPQTWCNTLWKGINVLKPPTDLWIYQELIFRLKPDLIIETGTMRGGSAVFMDDICKLIGHGRVITIDLVPEHVHPDALKSNVTFMHGSSVDPVIIDEVKNIIDRNEYRKVMVILDSDHSLAHVTNELNVYCNIVTDGMPLIVEDTGNCETARKAVENWLPFNPDFKTDFTCEKFMLTFNRGGYLEKQIKKEDS